MEKVLGLLVPLKKGSDYENVYHRFQNVRQVMCIFGLDHDDDIGRNILGRLGATVHSIVPADELQIGPTTPSSGTNVFPLCGLWRALALKAFSFEHVDAVLLVGDDVELLHDDVAERSLNLCQTGVVVISLRELNGPGWPCFPVVSRQ